MDLKDRALGALPLPAVAAIPGSDPGADGPPDPLEPLPCEPRAVEEPPPGPAAGPPLADCCLGAARPPSEGTEAPGRRGADGALLAPDDGDEEGSRTPGSRGAEGAGDERGDVGAEGSLGALGAEGTLGVGGTLGALGAGGGDGSLGVLGGGGGAGTLGTLGAGVVGRRGTLGGGGGVGSVGVLGVDGVVGRLSPPRAGVPPPVRTRLAIKAVVAAIRRYIPTPPYESTNQRLPIPKRAGARNLAPRLCPGRRRARAVGR